MWKLKIRRIGASVGLVLPASVVAKLGVEPGDTVNVIESPDGFRITAHGPAVAKQLIAARKVMKKRRAALRDLAK